MAKLVLFAALLGLTSAESQVYFLPSGLPYLHTRENFIPYASAIQIYSPTGLPIPEPVRVGVPEDHKLKAYTAEKSAFDTGFHLGQKERVNVEEKKEQGLSNERKILSPANTFLSPNVQPFAPRRLAHINGLPIPYAYPEGNAYTGIHEAVPTEVMVKQVFGSSSWDRNVIEWASKNCPPLTIIGGAVAGAGGGPPGIILGVVGAGIASCNFN